MRKGFWAEPVDVTIARRVAGIAGPSSAFAKAIEEFDRRTKDGEDLMLLRSNGSVVIVRKSDVIDSIVPITSGNQ